MMVPFKVRRNKNEIINSLNGLAKSPVFEYINKTDENDLDMLSCPFMLGNISETNR